VGSLLLEIISLYPLIHRFWEGNGRAARILAVLMGLQAGLPALMFDKLSGRKRRRYFAAVQEGLDRNYDPMTNLFTAVIEKTLQVHEKA
jgi:cell filamentation protein